VRGSERDLVIDGGLGVRATREALPWLFERDGVLFSGDALYDGALLDTLPGSDVGAYLSTIRALSTLDVRVVHAGHNDSFGRERLRALCDAYLARRR
jgi:glyoxylase-like metal-dependent hydrolase (beta-lactamase superfamily II)